MKIDLVQNFNLKDITLISSLPDMGRVGGLVTQHLAKKLDAKETAKIILSDKPWVNLKKGVIDLPHDEYSLLVDQKNSIVIFTGENQPQESSTVFDITNSIISTVQKMGNIKLVISTGGYLPDETEAGTGVFGVATSTKLLDMLKSYKIEPLSSEVHSITWFNGLILGIAKSQNIDGIGLFGEIIDPNKPQYKAASNIVKKIAGILKITVNTDELDQKIIEEPKEEKKEGPGIG